MSCALSSRDRELYPTLSRSVINAVNLGEADPLPVGYVPHEIDLFCNDAMNPDISVVGGKVVASAVIPPGWSPKAIELQLDGRPALVAIGDRVILNRLGNLSSDIWPINRKLTELIRGWING